MKEGVFKSILAGSLVLLVGSAQFFIYASYVTPRGKATQDLQALTDILQLEKQKKANGWKTMRMVHVDPRLEEIKRKRTQQSPLVVLV